MRARSGSLGCPTGGVTSRAGLVLKAAVATQLRPVAHFPSLEVHVLEESVRVRVADPGGDLERFLGVVKLVPLLLVVAPRAEYDAPHGDEVLTRRAK
jgi:hypothetical protein